jgi:hypothetical protein
MKPRELGLDWGSGSSGSLTSVAKEPWANLLAWCKAQRESLQMQREMLRSGRFSVFENHDSGQRDVSSEHIGRINLSVADLDAIIAEFERKSA